MERNELIEWIVMILVIVSWWPRIFFPSYDPLWYHVLIYYVGPVVLVAILAIRYKRVREGLEYSENVIKAQHKAAGRDTLGPSEDQAGPLPFMGPPADEDEGNKQ